MEKGKSISEREREYLSQKEKGLTQDREETHTDHRQVAI